MLISQPYLSSTAREPLQLIISDSGFYIYKDNRYYESIIAPAANSLDNYFETNIALPSKKMSKEEIYDLFFGNFTFTQNQAHNFLTTLLEQFKNLSDEEAIACHFIFPDWTVGQTYSLHEKIKYQNNLYEVLQNHTATSNLIPSQASGFYRKLKPSAEQTLEWEQKIYNLGDRVKYGEHIFESLIDNNNWSPEIFPNAWKITQ